MNPTKRFEEWRVRRLADGPPIERGAWLLDLGMPTPRAVRIHKAWLIQQARLTSQEAQ